MARAEKIEHVIVPERVIPAEVREEIVLTLSPDEADALLALTGAALTGGPTTPVYRALKRVVPTRKYYARRHPDGPVEIKKYDLTDL